MKLSILAFLLLNGCAISAEVDNATDASTTDAGTDASTVYCKVDSECSPNETCVWQQIAVYNPNVPGGFSGECEPR